MVKILLTKYQWYNNENTWVTGFIRIGGMLLVKEELLKYFSAADSFPKFETILKSANGQFSVVINSPGGILAASDRMRNYPLFYSMVDYQYIISDDCYYLAGIQSETRFNPDAVNCFLAGGFVINNLTLINNVYQVEAGGYIIISDSHKKGYYHDSCLEPTLSKDFYLWVNELEILIDKVFGCYLKSLNNKFIAIPLSGGYDSRLIAAMCAKFHPENVLCYTYGIKNNEEVAPAREAAKRLGIKWINIVYDEELIRDFLDKEVFKEYYPYVSELSGMFFMQEYFAVKHLKEEGLIPGDCVFIPGFSGDMIAGSHLSPAMNIFTYGDQIARMIFKEFFKLVNLDREDKSKVIELLRGKIGPGKLSAWKAIESFDMKERQAKFVVNSAKVYKYFGYDYIIPFWDKEFIDFFASVPFNLKLNKKLYDFILTKKIFPEKDINLKGEINPSPTQKRFQRFKDTIKPFVPDYLKNLFIERESPIFYDEITKMMLNDLVENHVIVPKQPNYYNSYITQWYLLKTRELFKII